MVCDVCAEMPTPATCPGLADSLRIRSKPDTIQIIRILQNCTAISVFSSSKIQIIPVRAYFRHISRIRTRCFKYLGSQLCRTCTDTLDVSSRMESAAKAFGALRKCLFASNNVSAAAKRVVYVSVILAILLYGCECWSLTDTAYGSAKYVTFKPVRYYLDLGNH